MFSFGISFGFSFPLSFLSTSRPFLKSLDLFFLLDVETSETRRSSTKFLISVGGSFLIKFYD